MRAGGLQKSFVIVAVGLIGLLLAACVASGDGSQVIFVPTGDGRVEAVTVHTGEPSTPSGTSVRDAATPEVDSARQEVDPDQVRRQNRTAVLSDSRGLTYQGASRETVFMTETAIRADIGSNIGEDWVAEGAFCPRWGAHLSQVTAGRKLIRCREYAVTGERLAGSGRTSASGGYTIMSYEFEGVGRTCDTPDRCIAPPLSHPAILTLPVCAAVIVHTFRTAQGETFRLIEATDPAVYGKRAEVGALSDADRSNYVFGTDYSKTNTRSSCNEFAEDNQQ